MNTDCLTLSARLIELIGKPAARAMIDFVMRQHLDIAEQREQLQAAVTALEWKPPPCRP